MKILDRLEKSWDFWFLVSTSFFFFLFRLPSLFEPYWYGDEGIYQVIGIAVREGRLLYRDIWDNKPPLLYLIYALFSSDQFTIRLVSLLFGISSIIAFFILSKKLFSSKKIVFFTTAFFSFLFALPLLEGNIANAENFMLFPLLISAILIIKYTYPPKKIYLIIGGALISFAFLIKTVAIFDLGAFFVFLAFVTYEKRSWFLKLLPFLVSFSIPIVAVVLFFVAQGALGDFLIAALKQNIGYVGYGNALIVKQGLLIVKILLLTAFLALLFLKRRNFQKEELFVLIWLAFSLFNAFFSQRPYIHYLLVLLPSFLLILGFIISSKKYKEVKLILFIFLIILLFNNFRFYTKLLPYYQNFILFVMQKISVNQYRSFFDKQTPIDYQLAQYVRSHTNKNETIFIWGNNGQVYKLSDKLPPGRYIVKYHITSNTASLNETAKILNEEKPKYIINTSINDLVPFNLSFYTKKLIIGNSVIYERIF